MFKQIFLHLLHPIINWLQTFLPLIFYVTAHKICKINLSETFTFFISIRKIYKFWISKSFYYLNNPSLHFYIGKCMQPVCLKYVEFLFVIIIIQSYRNICSDNNLEYIAYWTENEIFLNRKLLCFLSSLHKIQRKKWKKNQWSMVSIVN